MTDPLRIGGRAALPDGTTLVWSVAGGARGRRWREAVTDAGGLRRSLLLEASPVGDVTRLEMTTAAGLLTLHPSDDRRELHGNVVTPGGVGHLRFDWSPEHGLLVLGSPAAASVALRRLAVSLAIGEVDDVPAVWVDDMLEPRAGVWQVTRATTDTWQVRDPAGRTEDVVRLDADGIDLLRDAQRWPLELD